MKTGFNADLNQDKQTITEALTKAFRDGEEFDITLVSSGTHIHISRLITWDEIQKVFTNANIHESYADFATAILNNAFDYMKGCLDVVIEERSAQLIEKYKVYAVNHRQMLEIIDKGNKVKILSYLGNDAYLIEVLNGDSLSSFVN